MFTNYRPLQRRYNMSLPHAHLFMSPVRDVGAFQDVVSSSVFTIKQIVLRHKYLWILRSMRARIACHVDTRVRALRARIPTPRLPPISTNELLTIRAVTDSLSHFLHSLNASPILSPSCLRVGVLKPARPHLAPRTGRPLLRFGSCCPNYLCQ